MSSRWGGFPQYKSVAKLKIQNNRLAEKLIKEGYELDPIHVVGNKRHIATSFWGQSWCRHLNSFSDYSNRMPRGRSYVRHGAVLDLKIGAGKITALVSGSELYQIEIKIALLDDCAWKLIQKKCSGQVASLLELLQGNLSDEVMKQVADKNQGLFPSPQEITLGCSCPDWAEMCKHVAAAMYGVGIRLDNEPELLFLLRGVNAEDLITGNLSFSEDAVGEDGALDSGDLAGIFGIEIDGEAGFDDNTEVKACSGDDGFSSTNQNNNVIEVAKSTAFVPTGPAISRLRTDFDFSVDEFASLLEVTRSTVCRWEKNEDAVKPRKKVRKRLEHMAEIRGELIAENEN